MAYINVWIFLNIFTSLHYLTKACTPSYSGFTQITAFTRGSVLLPCTCINPQDKPKSVFWESNSRTASKDGIYTDISSVFELYSDRITLFNQTSPGNVSLLLSDLTKDDQGLYVCLLDKTSRFINVTIEDRSETTAASKLSHIVLISVLFLVIAAGGAAVIYCIHRAYRKATMETGEMNVENKLEDLTYGTLQKKYDAEEMYGTIGNRSKEQ